jgi:hypothetical protein
MILSLVPVFGWVQCEKMLTSTQGVSISVFVLAGLFTATLTWLAVSAFVKNRNKMTLKMVIVYICGVVVYTIMIGVAFIYSHYQWDSRDSLATCLVTILVTVIVSIAHHRGLKWYDPIMKGLIALAVRVIPNLMMAQKIWIYGGKGVSMWFIIIFNALTLLRIAQIITTSLKNGWDRERKGMMIGEIGNELSWLVVTIVWCVK